MTKDESSKPVYPEKSSGVAYIKQYSLPENYFGNEAFLFSFKKKCNIKLEIQKVKIILTLVTTFTFGRLFFDRIYNYLSHNL